MLDPPKESGSYIVDATFEGGNRDVTILHWTELSEPTRLRTGFWDCQCRIEEIHAYRRLTDNDLRELLHGPQESGPPDRPGWWRFESNYNDMSVYRVIHENGSLGVIDEGETHVTPISGMKGAWYGRVEMPGEK